MRWKLWIGAALSVGIAAASAWGELPRGKTRPRPACGIPDYAYSNNAAAKPTTTAVTLVRVPANRLTTATATPASPQVYQLAQVRMQVDHCFLSRVAVGLYDDGNFAITFRADQNPAPSDDPASPLRGDDFPPPRATLQTAQLLRNQFLVTVRGYANYPVEANPPKLAAPKPALVEFKVEPFWVERGKPYSGNVTGISEMVRRNFEFIDRIEVEFTYK